MNKYRLIGLLVVAVFFIGCQQKREGNPKVLVFSKTMGFKHNSIPAGIAAIEKLGSENNFVVDTTKNAALFTDENLKQYSAIIFLSTTGNVLDNKQEAAFERYIQSGGGFVGIHAATDTEYDWNWYGRLVGAYFESHPPGTPEADFKIIDKSFAATSFFTDSIWHRTDEMYNFKKIYEPINVIMTVDESTYEGGTNGDFHPMAWYHEYDGGRSFYTAMGHTVESFSEENFLKHILAGIQYAIGDNYELQYKKAVSQLPPAQDRFSKEVLSVGKFYEPTEMTILPNNDVLIAQRRGQIMRYNAATTELTEIASLDVYHTALSGEGINVENGLMGLQKDPDFVENHWIYIYYSPAGDEWVNRLSRIKYVDGELDMSSEQFILDVKTDREVCCHTGGSIAFGPDKLLYLSTGDNSTPFDEVGVPYANRGFAPLNDIPGKQNFDAARSSGNSNDLRGKVLRIKVNDDGTYDIPDNNLFPEGTAKTRPEIYTMGHRNPYRISVDQKNGNLYWGEVGPDAQGDSLSTRGPRGYDEVNQATEAGNFGWPFFIADNQAYVNYNYQTGESGLPFDPEQPVNNSRNNTGVKNLPKAMPAFVYYPYAASQEFPQLGTGGRNAMAGPVYYSDLYKGNEKLPAYFDGKLLIYDWMRGWMKAVSFFDDGSFNKMEPFADEVEINSLIDMELGPDGRLYLLEYGTGWFTQNSDSGLSYIQYNGGNRPPVIDHLIVDKDSGGLPLKIQLEAQARDRESDPISYIWDLGDGTISETEEAQITHEYQQAGEYEVSVSVKDNLGAVAKSEVLKIVAGNTRPEVTIKQTGGNSMFYFAGSPISYEVKVSDPDSDTPIDPGDILVTVDYVSGLDKSQLSQGHKIISEAEQGKGLSQSLDCKVCHKEKEASVGPSYLEISERYKDDPNAASYLQNKIIAGGGGVWGEVVMAAHPDLTQSETRMLAEYILSLARGDAIRKNSLPPVGTINPEQKSPDAVLLLTASYTDEGNGTAIPLTGSQSIHFQSNMLTFSEATPRKDMNVVNYDNMDLLLLPPQECWFAFEDIDLTAVKAATLTLGWMQAPETSINFELRLGSADGDLIGKGSLDQQVQAQEGQITMGQLTIQFDKEVSAKGQDLYFIHKPKEGEDGVSSLVAIISATMQAGR